MPTAAGKTVLFVAITRHFKKKTLILAHRDELLTQAKNKFKEFWPNSDVGIYQGKNSSLDHQVIISLVQTCSQPNRLAQLKKEGFSLLVIDECHHATSKSYQKIINELGFVDNPEKLLIGVTATPNRSDKKSLSHIFQEIVFDISIDELIQTNFLSSVTARRLLTSIKLNNIKTSMGDFEIGQLAMAVNIPERNSFIVNKWKEYATNRKTLAFCVSVQHCKDLAAEFNSKEIVAAAVWGNMPYNERQQILHKFHKGTISVVTSCSLLTEGFDEPSISCVLMARPTKSQSLYIQMVGRGLRKDKNPETTKENCLVLDFTDKHNNLDMIISLKDIMPNAPIIDEVSKKETTTNINAAKQEVRSDVDIDEEYNILGKMKCIWIRVNDMYSLTDDYKNEIVLYKQGDNYIANVFCNNGDVEQIIVMPTSLRKCKMMCEAWAKRNLTITYADQNSSWFINNENKPGV